MRLSSVVLPAPLGPMTPRNWCRFTANDRLSVATRPPKLRVRLRTSSIGSEVASGARGGADAGADPAFASPRRNALRMLSVAASSVADPSSTMRPSDST